MYFGFCLRGPYSEGSSRFIFVRWIAKLSSARYRSRSSQLLYFVEEIRVARSSRSNYRARRCDEQRGQHVYLSSCRRFRARIARYFQQPCAQHLVNILVTEIIHNSPRLVPGFYCASMGYTLHERTRPLHKNSFACRVATALPSRLSVASRVRLRIM